MSFAPTSQWRPLDEREAMRLLWMSASTVVSSWTFYFFFILTNASQIS
ncbi:hypothetical protein V6Z11_A10G286200 [Gossypium hirsutum]